MVEILALKEGYTPELSFPEQVQGLASNYVDNMSPTITLRQVSFVKCLT